MLAPQGLTSGCRVTSNPKPRPEPSEGQVAQSVEQRTENPRVGCSIHPLATIPLNNYQRMIYYFLIGEDDSTSVDRLSSCLWSELPVILPS